MFLGNLRKDVLLVLSVGANNWNHTILKEVIRLIIFLCNIFTDIPSRWLHLKLPWALTRNFDYAMEEVESIISLLVTHLCESEKNKELVNEARTQNKEKISSKTIRKLFILNQLNQSVLDGRLILVDKLAVEQKAKEIGKILKTAKMFKNTMYSIRNYS